MTDHPPDQNNQNLKDDNDSHLAIYNMLSNEFNFQETLQSEQFGIKQYRDA